MQLVSYSRVAHDISVRGSSLYAAAIFAAVKPDAESAIGFDFGG